MVDDNESTVGFMSTRGRGDGDKTRWYERWGDVGGGGSAQGRNTKRETEDSWIVEERGYNKNRG